MNADRDTGALRDRFMRAVAWARSRKPARVVEHYLTQRGPLLAAGLSYQAMFAVFGSIWVAFSVAGLVIAASPAVTDALFQFLAFNVPGLIDLGEGGAIKPDDLLSSGVFGWTGVIALAITLFTAIGWLASMRDAIRELARLPSLPTNAVLLKLRDLGFAIGFGLAMLLSAALSLVSSRAITFVLSWFGLREESEPASFAVQAAAVAIVFVLDTATLMVLFRLLAGVPIPRRPLVQGSVLGAAVLGVLKILGTSLLGGASRNPLLASFAVVIGLLIWFNLVNQVNLIAATWVIVSANDAGVPLDPIGERERREAEARLRLQIEREVRAEVEAELPAAARWLVRRRRRRQEQ